MTNRRTFIQSTLLAGTVLGIAPAVHSQRNKTYRIALIGSGWWGMNILHEAMQAGNGSVVALCDVNPTQLNAAQEEVVRFSNQKPKGYMNFQELLEKEDIDIAVIATPDHWHALNTIAALKKDIHVFVEKPTGHTILESRAMVNTAKETGKTVQVGLHRRIGPHHVSAMEFLRSGKAGKVGMVRMFVHGGGGKESPKANSEPPAGMDWDLYCGPAPLRPFNSKIHPGGFRHFMDFANGTLGDWGVHWLDQVLWWSEEKYPKKVYSTGGRPVRGEAVYTDREQTTDTPDSQVAVYEFESFTATWEHRRFAGNETEKHQVGCYFYGENGILHMGWRDGWTFYPANNRDGVIHQEPELQEPDGHNLRLLWKDFIAAIESGKPPVSHIEQAHYSTNMSLLGMLSYKVGRSIEWDGEKERIVNDPEANQLLKREYRKPWTYPV